MEKMMVRNSLRKNISGIFAVIFLIVTVLSLMIIMLANHGQQDVLKRRQLTVSMVGAKVSETSSGELIISGDGDNAVWAPLSSKDKILYYGSMVLMVAAPLGIMTVGLVTGSRWFYRKKLKEPIAQLTHGITSMGNKDLEFTLDYSSDDELGILCQSFNEMKDNLRESQLAVSRLSEDRRLLIASVAHDIRNPLMILKGYQSLLLKTTKEPQTEKIVRDMSSAIKRLENYAEGIREIQNIDQMVIKERETNLETLMLEWSLLLSELSHHYDWQYQLINSFAHRKVMIDPDLLSRVMENVLSNSARYAHQMISINITVDSVIEITILDDGPGFSNRLLHQGPQLFTSGDVEHWGLGLYVSSLLVNKMGGKIFFSNRKEGGASVQIRLPKEP